MADLKEMDMQIQDCKHTTLFLATFPQVCYSLNNLGL